MDKYEHSLQMAYRCWQRFVGRENRAEWVIAGLFHDVFGALNPEKHAEWIASTLRRKVSPEVERVLHHHSSMMETHWHPERPWGWNFCSEMSGRPWFLDAIAFRDADIASFDPAYRAPRLDYWTPEILSVLS